MKKIKKQSSKDRVYSTNINESFASSIVSEDNVLSFSEKSTKKINVSSRSSSWDHVSKDTALKKQSTRIEEEEKQTTKNRLNRPSFKNIETINKSKKVKKPKQKSTSAPQVLRKATFK